MQAAHIHFPRIHNVPQKASKGKGVEWHDCGATPIHWTSKGLQSNSLHMQAAGENAEEELAALLEESGASMHTQKESNAKKAVQWHMRRLSVCEALLG